MKTTALVVLTLLSPMVVIGGSLYSVTDLGTLGGPSGTVAYGINNAGQVVGASWTGLYGGGGAICGPFAQCPLSHAFVWNTGTMTDLGIPPGANGIDSIAYGINRSGQIAGSWTYPGYFSGPFFYTGGQMNDLSPLTGTSSGATALNDSGRVVGGDGQPFLYGGGTLTHFGTLGGIAAAAGINGTDQIVGFSYFGGNKIYHAVLWSAGQTKDLGTLSGGTNSRAYGINAGGQVVGVSEINTGGASHAFLYSSGTMTDLGTLGGSSSQADAINVNGQIVGWANTADGSRHAVLWSAGAMTDLNTAVSLPAGVVLVEATGINDFSRIIANGSDGRAYLLTPPKPIVILVPGIGGTKLANTSEIVWISNATINAAVTGFGSPFYDLQYDLSGHSVTTLTTNASTAAGDFGGLFNLASNTLDSHYALDCNTTLARIFANDCTKNIYVYNTIYADLINAGYFVQQFPYDWRRDIGDLSEDLFSQLTGIANVHPNQPIAIVAHSMGGLILQEMLERHGPSVDTLTNMGPLITLGAPFAGSVDTYLKFQGWQALIPGVIEGQLAQAIGSNWTAAYELLPRWDFAQIGGVTIPYKQLYAGQSQLSQVLPLAGALPRSSALTEAYALWAEPPVPTYPQAYAVIGTGYPTVIGINDNDHNGCPQALAGNGDGTVPLRSARAASWILPSNIRYVNEVHEGLPSNAAVIGAVLRILNGAPPDNLQTSPTGTKVTTTGLCSPADVVARNSGGQTVGHGISQITGGQYFKIGTSAQVWLPAGDLYSLQLNGTGLGIFTAIVKEVDQDGNTLHSVTFNRVPVGSTSKGTIQIADTGVGALSYDYTGKGTYVDTIPSNVTPATIQCTGAYFLVQGVRATLSFNVGYTGAVSTFAYNFRTAGQTVQFASATTSQISVTGKTATFSGLGTLNGDLGYNFTVTATDGGAAGSGLDSVSITLTGPNGYSYSVTSAILGGDIVIHP